MTHDQILNETLKYLLPYFDISKLKGEEDIIKLILENYGLATQIELLKEINERRE